MYVEIFIALGVTLIESKTQLNLNGPFKLMYIYIYIYVTLYNFLFLQATLREEELVAELNEEKKKAKSHSATVQDQVDHIAMLREQVRKYKVSHVILAYMMSLL